MACFAWYDGTDCRTWTCAHQLIQDAAAIFLTGSSQRDHTTSPLFSAQGFFLLKETLPVTVSASRFRFRVSVRHLNQTFIVADVI